MKNTKLIMFQFKINHNIIYTKDKLKRANIAPCNLCYLCKSEQYTIQHMFLKFSHAALFWNECFDWWSQVTTKTFSYQTQQFYTERTYKPTQTPSTPELGFAGGTIPHVTLMNNRHSSHCLRYNFQKI